MKIAIVLTSHDQLGDTGKKTGFWLEELAAPYLLFREAGVDITLASPKGGFPSLDPRSCEAAYQTDDTRRFESDASAMASLKATRRLSLIAAAEFDAVFFSGGYGALWDLTNDPDALSLIETMLATSKPVALVSHAPGILTNVRTPDDRPITMGLEVTGFTNSEESVMQFREVVSFLLEDLLKSQGAKFSAAEDFNSYVIRDGLLVTGQNPSSSRTAAITLLIALQTE
ncbi:LOW QUALITY PROTEIN: putative intracellular protease/amidase [Rhizobium mongolense USDA 1844]|nr:LOW QUALITY PROTEIN: putative intracellular protease/amidase [Rhizobium mongolense USDA 1844]